MPARSTLGLVAAAVTAVVAVTAATVVIAERSSAPTSTKTITGAGEKTPGVAWSLDAAKLLERPFGQFSDPRRGASYRSGEPGLLLVGDTLVTIAGSPTDQYVLDDAVMIGIDPANGTVRWKAPAADVEQCSGTPLGGRIYCCANARSGGGSDIVTYDIESGASARRSIAEFVFGIETTADTLYIAEGNPEDSDVRVHSGTYDDVSAHWTRSFDLFTTWDGVYEEQVLTVRDGSGLIQTGGQMAQFDADSGAELWRSTDYRVRTAGLHTGGVVVQANTDGETNGKVIEQVLRGPNGEIRAVTTSPVVQGGSAQQGSSDDGPVLMGDSAYDRSTGKRLWTTTDLVVSGGDLGTVTEVAGDTVYLRDTDRSETGIDLRSGKRLWRNTVVEHFTPAASRGDVVIGADGSALTAFDVRSGTKVWSAPFTAIDPNPDTFSSSGAAEWADGTWVYSSDRRMIGLAPR